MTTQAEKRLELSTKIKNCFFGLFNNLVQTNINNGVSIILGIFLETLIYIHTLNLQASELVHLDSWYSYLTYINVFFIEM